MNRVVITGMGAITPIGNNLKTYWENLLAGTSGARPITRFDASMFRTQFACEVKEYEPLDYFDRKDSRKLDRFSQYGLVAVNEAVQDAGINFLDHDSTRLGVICSSGIGGFETFEQEVTSYALSERTPRFNPHFITQIIPNSLAGHISIKYGIRGINYCPVSACSSSAQSIIHAFNYIQLGKADIIIAGGSEAPVTKASIGGFNAMKAMSVNNENYMTASRPFDKTRDGFVVGEGAGALIIESLDSALKRNARIYAEIAGGGESSDAFHITGTHPEGEGAYLAMKQALEEGNVHPSEINYINAHATSTGLGDLSEIAAISRLFSSINKIPQISATKSMTGHLLGATGATEAIATGMSIYSGQIPPTINTTDTDDNIPAGLNLTLGTKISGTINFALSNSFGFGGHCATLLLKKFEP